MVAMLERLEALFKRLTGRSKRRELTIETSGLTRVQIEVGQKALTILGLEDPSRLSKKDVILFLYAVGLNPTDDVLDSKFRLVEVHTQEFITFADLCHIWHSMLQDLTDEDEILKRAFQFFDKDGNGEITVTELRNTMHELGDLLTEQEIETFMQIMDVNNDGVIGYEEFLDTLRTQAVDAIGAEEEFFGEASLRHQYDTQEDARDSGERWSARGQGPTAEGKERMHGRHASSSVTRTQVMPFVAQPCT